MKKAIDVTVCPDCSTRTIITLAIASVTTIKVIEEKGYCPKCKWKYHLVKGKLV